MNRTAVVYCGALFTALAAFSGFVAAPNWQLARLAPVDDGLGDPYPVEPGGRVLAGRRVYVSLGCIYCHTQQVRAAGLGADQERGWGLRRTVARDYLFDDPPLLGTMRTGPDLSSIGLRQPSPAWHFLHLYQPRRSTPDSTMPPHPFLFDVCRTDEPPRAGRVTQPSRSGPRQVVLAPSADAEALVAYLLSLQRDRDVPEVR